MLQFIMGALLTITAPTPLPAPPCANHHFLCGGIRLVPRDPDAREVWIANALATLADGVVTSIGTRGNPQMEQNLVMRPFVRARFTGLILGWTAMQMGQHALDERFHISDTRMQAFAFGQHVSGVASWLSPRTYAWTPNEWAAYHQPIAEAAWIRYSATGGKF